MCLGPSREDPGFAFSTTSLRPVGEETPLGTRVSYGHETTTGFIRPVSPRPRGGRGTWLQCSVVTAKQGGSRYTLSLSTPASIFLYDGSLLSSRIAASFSPPHIHPPTLCSPSLFPIRRAPSLPPRALIVSPTPRASRPSSFHPTTLFLFSTRLSHPPSTPPVLVHPLPTAPVSLRFTLRPEPSCPRLSRGLAAHTARNKGVG